MGTLNYFQSTHLKQGELDFREQKNIKQNELVLDIFKKHKSKGFTPWEIHSIAINLGFDWPIGSIRRAMNTLTRKQKLLKTNSDKIEKYGHTNSIWKLNTKYNENNLYTV